MKEGVLHIAYATDDGYLMPTYVAASSALYWAMGDSKRIVIHILDVDITASRWVEFTDGLRNLFGDRFGLVRHKISSERFSGLGQWHNSLAAYARLLLPELLPSVNWCLYCDGDTLFTGNPLELLRICDNRYALIGHRDNDCRAQMKWFYSHGYVFKENEYVCSGFLLLNLDKFRESRYGEKCFEFISKHLDVMFPDQDALNIVCQGQILQLNDNWGEFGYKYIGVSSSGCIHYGSQQPWKLKYTRHRGMLDIEYVWFGFAMNVCRLPLRDLLMGKSLFRYAMLRLCSAMCRLGIAVFARLPLMRRRTFMATRQMIGRDDYNRLTGHA